MTTTLLKTLSVCPKCFSLNRIAVEKALQQQPKCGQCKTALPHNGFISDVDDIALQRLMHQSEMPLAVDFWAPWCGPCRMFAPVFEDVARRKAGQVLFAKLNTEAFAQAGQRYAIRSIPTLILFKDGRELKRQSGVMQKPVFEQWLQT